MVADSANQAMKEIVAASGEWAAIVDAHSDPKVSEKEFYEF